ncbi:MAG: hypothetical protein ACREQL_15235 [Candidatus Binatia bacterium]
MIAWWCARTSRLGTWLTPYRRRRILAVGAIGGSVGYPLKTVGDRADLLPAIDTSATLLGVPLLLAFVYACYRAAAAFDRLPSPVRRHPQVTLHLTFWLALVACWLVPPGRGRGVLSVLVVVLPFILWKCGYLLLSGQRGRVSGTSFGDHLMYIFPLWGGGPVAFGKGLDHLARHEARTSEALARSQLAGMKLLALSVLWALVALAFRGLVFGDPDNPLAQAVGGRSLGVPRLATLLEGPTRVALPLAWVSVYSQLALDTLKITIQGHAFIGVLRLFGFYVFRNTYKPLLAESVLDFWNRQYFYFKELMVDFFFLPTFVRRFRSWPRLRMVAAVFAAAGFGNVYYHLLKVQVPLIHGDPAAVWTAIEPRAFYGILLATGIAVSMHREQRRRLVQRKTSYAHRAARIAVVLTFLAVIRIWAVTDTEVGAVRRAEFVLTLVALR